MRGFCIIQEFYQFYEFLVILKLNELKCLCFFTNIKNLIQVQILHENKKEKNEYWSNSEVA